MHVGRGFARPVTEIYRRNAEFCAEYSAIIAEPMDLGTIGEKLARGEYAVAANVDWASPEFVSDVQLVFNNCKQYNPKKRNLAPGEFDFHKHAKECDMIITTAARNCPSGVAGVMSP